MDKNYEELKLRIRQLSLSENKNIDPEVRWKQLQKAHIESQAYWTEHTMVHLYMLTHAFKTFRAPEFLIQIVFAVVAAPSSLLKIYPKEHPGTLTIGQ